LKVFNQGPSRWGKSTEFPLCIRLTYRGREHRSSLSLTFIGIERGVVHHPSLPSIHCAIVSEKRIESIEVSVDALSRKTRETVGGEYGCG
jgi:hypothetical protein